MFSDLNTGQKIFMIVTYILTFIVAVLGMFAIVTMFNVKKPFTLGVTYADKLDKEDGGKVPIFNVTVHENKNNNGLVVYDMQINSYTDHQGNGIAGFGIQSIGNYHIINNSGIEKYQFISSLARKDADLQKLKDEYGNMFMSNDSGIFGDFYTYYTGDDGLIYTLSSVEDIPDYMLISIEDNYYRITLKEYEVSVINDDPWAFLPWIPSEKVITCQFSWFEVFDMVISSAMNSSAKVEYEEFKLNLFDLSDFITIEYLDSTGKYQPLKETTENRNYFTIYVNYNLNGLKDSSDSLFKMVYGSADYDYDNVVGVKDYDNVISRIIIGSKKLNYKLIDGVHYAYLDADFANYLASLKSCEILVNLDFTSLDFVVFGIDLSNFYFLKEDIEIKHSLGGNPFVLLNKGLCPVNININGGV